ncbi:MAG: DUF2786 domain-containing protein [Actinobacteria bacterium]|nr:DUF2786 domain-containing protein [Actinomycetota bacterium]
MADHPTTDRPTGQADAWLDRVSALLAKAESTEYPEEAEALLAKAQELMSRHAIDEAMLARSGRRASAIGTRTIVVPPPYATAKASLLGAVAQANDCRVVMGPAGGGRQTCIALGHDADLDAVEALFAALCLHAVRSMLAARVPSGDTARRFRHAFLLAFAGRIGERLRAARRTAEYEASAVAPAGEVAVVLADRARDVDRAFREAFPRVRTMRTTSSSSAGRASGRRAADSAGLGQRAVGGNRPLPGR